MTISKFGLFTNRTVKNDASVCNLSPTFSHCKVDFLKCWPRLYFLWHLPLSFSNLSVSVSLPVSSIRYWRTLTMTWSSWCFIGTSSSSGLLVCIHTQTHLLHFQHIKEHIPAYSASQIWRKKSTNRAVSNPQKKPCNNFNIFLSNQSYTCVTVPTEKATSPCLPNVGRRFNSNVVRQGRCRRKGKCLSGWPWGMQKNPESGPILLLDGVICRWERTEKGGNYQREHWKINQDLIVCDRYLCPERLRSGRGSWVHTHPHTHHLF